MHQITLKGLDDEELEIIQEAVNGNLSLTLADCLPRILKRLTMTVFRDVDGYEPKPTEEWLAEHGIETSILD